MFGGFVCLGCRVLGSDRWGFGDVLIGLLSFGLDAGSFGMFGM